MFGCDKMRKESQAFTTASYIGDIEKNKNDSCKHRPQILMIVYLIAAIFLME